MLILLALRERLLALLMVAAITVMVSPLAAQGQTDEERDNLIRTGADLYSSQCAGCHQAGGVGLTGTFPPLLDNPDLQDAAYLSETIRNGRSGEIEVDGTTYNGVMPPFAKLSDAEIAGLVAYIQAGFVLPAQPTVPEAAAAAPEPRTPSPVAAGTAPALSGWAILGSILAVGAIGIFGLRKRIFSTIERLNMPWLDAGLRAVLTFAFFVFGTAVIPSLVLKSEVVSRLSRVLQDLIGSAVWFLALAVGLWALWWAHRENRI